MDRPRQPPTAEYLLPKTNPESRAPTDDNDNLVADVFIAFNPECATGSASAGQVQFPATDRPPSVTTTSHSPPPVSSLLPQFADDRGAWPASLFALWAGGALIVTLMHCRQIHRVRRLVRQSRPAPLWLVERVGRLANTIGVSPPLALVAAHVLSPCLWCLGRPKLLWPEALADPSRADDWDGVIAHELAHLRRRDHWLAWFELIAGCLWWFHPLYWLVRKRLRESAELACDAWAVWAIPGGQRAYAESLVEVTRLVSRAATPAPALGASTGARRSLERRLTMILAQPVPCKMPLAGSLGAGLLALLALPAWSLEQSPPGADAAAPADSAPDRARPQPSPKPTKSADLAAPAASPEPAGIAVIGTERPVLVRTGSGDATTIAVVGTEQPVAVTPTPSDADRITKLEQQLDVLLKEVRSLRPVRTRGDATANTSPLRAVAPDGKIIAVMSGVGQVTLLDAATGKELARTNIGQEAAIRSIAFSPDGKQIAVQSDASEVITLDAATGKINRVTKEKSATRKTRDADPDTDAVWRRERALHTRTSAKGSAVESAAPPAAASIAASISSAQLDLVRLATEYTDAVGRLKLAERMLDIARKTRETGESTLKDVVTAEVHVQNAAQKLNLLRQIAQAAAEAAQHELEAAEKRAASGADNRADAAQVQAKLRILKLILGSH